MTSLIEKIHINKLKVILDNFEDLYDSIGSLKDPSKGFSCIEDNKTVNTILWKYYRLKIKTETINYNFSRGIKWGRLFSTTPSLQCINKKLRHTLASDIYTDIDIVNCHPVILLKYCNDNNIRCENLKYFVENRDSYLKQLSDRFHITRDDAKKTFLSIINGARRSEKYPLDIIINFEEEIQQIIYYFVKQDCNKIFIKRSYNTKKTRSKTENLYNIGGSAINLFFCHEENAILKVICDSLTSRGFQIGSLCFDGCLVYKSNDLTDDLFNTISKEVQDKLGYRIEIKVKPMTEIIDLSQYIANTNSNPNSNDFKIPIEFNERDVGLFTLDRLNPCMLYDKHKSEFYFYNKTTALWERNDWDIIKTFIYQCSIEYCESKNIQVHHKILSKITTSSWSNNILKIIVPHIKRDLNHSKLVDSLLNKKPLLFPIAKNKVINIITKEIRDRTPEDYFTETTECIYKETYDKLFLDEYIGSLLMTTDQKYIDHLLMCVAYSLTGENNLKRFFILNGAKNGGKSLFLLLINNIFKSFGGSVNSKIFRKSQYESSHDAETFTLIGKRMVFVSEMEEKDSFNEVLIKKITGGDSINIRNCNSDRNIEVTLNCIMWLGTNEIPTFKDDAFISRMKVFEFPNKFTFNDQKREEILSKKDDLFSYLIDKTSLFYSQFKKFDDVYQVVQYTNKIVNSKNSIYNFMKDVINITGKHSDRINKSLLFDLYSQYCDQSGFNKIGRYKFYEDVISQYNIKHHRQREFTGILYNPQGTTDEE